MSNHSGTLWSNTPGQVHRRTGPGTNYALIDSLSPGHQLIVLCDIITAKAGGEEFADWGTPSEEGD